MNSTVRYTDVMLEELKMLKGWKEFIEHLTVDWLVENFERSYRSRHKLIGMVRLRTYPGILEIQWEDSVYGFKYPSVNQFELNRALTFEEDENLSRCLPHDVLREFIRVIEL